MDNVGRKAPPVEQRVAHIAEMMRSLEWQRGRSAVALAAEWGLAVPTVEGNACEAHRIVLAEVADPKEVTRTVCSALSTVLSDALAESKGAIIRDTDYDADGAGGVITLDYDPNKSRKIVIDAAKTWAQITGGMVQKHEVTGPNGGPIQAVDLSKLTDEQLERLARGESIAASAGGTRVAKETEGE